ncbi:glycerophosphodiester phosphodiesterase [Niallia sp. RD1]|uniref:glycerophosphodiester phosphodiesterase n=2 Tax=Niallia sp. RD1 TaxID=2962858 RepID=UPI0020C1AA47|nr:glycerophosphodiester phosphodiesterase [Niallia sp. RD1]UTI41127.1 glycerophosphodiester phosphodiesterase [Niallia sp. RD1]
MADAQKLLPTDTLRVGYPKINDAIDNANEALTTSQISDAKADEAVATANAAKTKADSVQEQFNQVVIEGDSSVEAAQARVDSHNNVFATLKERLDTKEDSFTAQLANILGKIEGTTKISELTSPQYLAHRGSSFLYPENTLEAFKMSKLNGALFIELDIRQDRTGSLCVIHDEEVIRVTGINNRGTDRIQYLNPPYVRSMKVDGLLPNYPAQPIAYLEEVFQTFGNKVNYAIESKDRRSAEAIANMAEAYRLQGHVLIQSFSQTELNAINDRGFDLLLLSDNVTDTEALLDNNIKYVGCSTSVSDSYVSMLNNAGIKVLVYTVNHQYLAKKYIALGAFGVFSDDPFYVSNNYPTRKDAPFSERVFSSGFIPHYAEYRGGFTSDYRWGFLTKSEDRDFVLQGWAGELPDTFTMTLNASFIERANGWGSIAICTPIDYFDDNKTTLSNGYHLLFSPKGISIYKVKSGVGTSLAISAEIGNLTDGATKNFTVTVSATSITFSTNDATITVNDSEFRNGFLHFGRKWGTVSFQNVLIS